jgi:hypothetical protein
MIVADTSAWIGHVRSVDAPHTELLDYELLYSRIATGDLIIAEFLQGFREEKDHEEAKLMMESLECHDYLGKEMALRSAANYRMLRKKGVTVRKIINLIIATFCVEHDFEPIHNDRDFDALEAGLGLRVGR